jgi:GTP-binding protein
MTVPYQKAYFLLSVAEIKQLPADQGVEVAVVGRSNAGKSSVLNCITQNKKLARVSKTPGRTQFLNIFAIDALHRLVDLPGYGYAKVPVTVKQKWQKTVDMYVRIRESLKGMVLVMDIRHPLKEWDVLLLEYCVTRALPVHILLNKADKLSKHDIARTLRAFTKALEAYDHPISFQLFSALKMTGMKELYALLDQWYGYQR